MILDTPGLTGPKTGICNKFDRAALNLSSTIVYVREYQGLPTEVDVNVIEKLLKCSARSKDRKILICLDKGKTKLTEDAASEIFDMTAQEEQMHWLHRLQELLSNRMSSLGQQAVKSCLISVEFAELNGDKKFEDKFNKDPRKAGIWTASSIGGWISDYVGPSPQEMDEE